MTATNNLTAMYVTMYKDSPKILFHIIDSQASKTVMLQSYRMLVNDGSMQPIENIPVIDKIKLVDECRATGMAFNNKSLTDSARILHAIKFINSNAIVDI